MTTKFNPTFMLFSQMEEEKRLKKEEAARRKQEQEVSAQTAL